MSVPKRIVLTTGCILFSLMLAATGTSFAQRAEPIIIDHSCTVLEDIPEEWVIEAKDQLRICYGHTSHGSQPISGMQVLMDDPGYQGLYDFNYDGAVEPGVLSLQDTVPEGDLGNPDYTTWAARTRSHLDGPGSDRNVVIWSWCGQVDTTSENIDIYLGLMNQLEADYPDVSFVYMTGHLNGTGETGNVNLRNNQIRAFCIANNKTLYDFADIESYDPDGNYFLDQGADDECNYDGGNWADEWCDSHPGSPLCIDCTCAHSRPLNCNLKARAFWRLLAEIAGMGTKPDEYSIAFSPSSLVFTALEGGSPPAAQTLEIWREGDGTLDWTAAESTGWLSLSPASGSSTGEHDPVTVAVDAAGLQTGTFNATITISDPGALNSPQTVPVSLTVTSAQTFITAGPGPDYGNSPEVRVFPPEQDSGPIYTFAAYGSPHYGVNVSCGRVAGGSGDVILTGAGPGDIYGPHVRGFSADGTPVGGLSFLAYGTNKFGVNVAAGDLDADGYDEIITGAGPGAVFGPHVRAFDFDGAPPVSPVAGVSYFAYGTLKYGVNIAAGDLDGDGYDEIVTGAGPGAVFGPHVRGWNVDGGAATPIPGVSWFAYGTLKYGVHVAAGDLDGDGLAEIVTAPGPSSLFGAHVRGWNVDGTVSPMPGFSFFAWPASQSTYGARIFAGADLNDDGRDDLVAGAGPDPAAGTPVQVYRYLGGTAELWFSLEAFPAGTTSGTSVAGGDLG